MFPVKILGRHIIFDEIIWLSSSGSRVDFTCEHCTKGTIVLHGDRTSQPDSTTHNRARYCVYLDGYPICTDVMDTPEKVIPLPFGTDSGCAVTVMKISEASQSNLGVELRDFDGTVRPAEKKKRTIEFIGDSITCGYGIDGNVSMIYSTAIEDVRRSYAGRLAEALDADAAFTCFSGFGIVSGYTGDGVKNTQILVPDCYEKVGFCDQPIPGHERVNNYEWDFSFFQPEQIVINLGTNDLSYTKGEPEKEQEYIDGYVAFLKTVRRRNPDAAILCVLGLMGTGLNDSMVRAVERYQSETGDLRVQARPVADQLKEDGYVPDFHPTPVSDQKLADQLLPLLR